MARRSSLTAALGEGGDAKWWEKAIEEEEENKTPWRALVTEDGLDYYMNIDTQGKKNTSSHTLLLTINIFNPMCNIVHDSHCISNFSCLFKISFLLLSNYINLFAYICFMFFPIFTYLHQFIIYNFIPNRNNMGQARRINDRRGIEQSRQLGLGARENGSLCACQTGR